MLRSNSKFIYAGLIVLGVFSFLVLNKLLQESSLDQYFSAEIGYLLAVLSLASTIIGIAGLIAHNRNQENTALESYCSLVKNKKSSPKEIKQKVSQIFRQIDRVRMYRRHAWGVGDFTPLIRVRRYIQPNDELIKYIDSLEVSLFDHIARHGDEQAVDESLAKATEIAEKIVNKLDSIK